MGKRRNRRAMKKENKRIDTGKILNKKNKHGRTRQCKETLIVNADEKTT